MTITAPLPLAPHAPLAGIAEDYLRLGEFLDGHPRIASLLSHVHSIPLRGHTPEERKAELASLAAEMGAEVVWKGTGVEGAELRFGGRVVLEVHHSERAFIEPYAPVEHVEAA